MDDVREGLLTYGTGASTTDDVRLMLAEGPNSYRPFSRHVWPDRLDVSGGGSQESAGESLIRRWAQRRWDRGELRGLWEPDGYRQSVNVKPDREGDRLELGAFREVAQHDGAAAFADGVKFGKGQGLLFAADDTPLSWWQTATEDFDQTGWATGVTTQTVVSIADVDDGTNMLLSLDDKSVRKVSSGANAELIAAGTPTYAQELRTADGTVYALDGADLYSVNVTTGARTVLSNPGGSVASYMASAGNIYRRMCVTDTGVAWLVPEDNGTVRIMEYNVSTNTDYRSGKLPNEGVFPYSIWYAHGFLFVGYRYAAAHNQKGDAYIYYQSGGARGTSGVLRCPEASTASQPVIIAGLIGDDLIIYYASALWSYDLSTGSLFQLAESQASAPTSVTDAACLGKEVFLANTDGAGAVERYDTGLYTTDTATWSSGRFDFDLPGVKKALLRVTVVVDALQTNTSMTLKVGTDGGTPASVTGTFTGDNSTTVYTWTVSASGGTNSQVVGRDFELEFGFATTDSAKSPKVRAIYAEAAAAEKRRGVEIDVDLSHRGTVKASDATRILAQIRSAAEFSGAIIKFTDPWGVATHEAKRTSDVLVEVVGGLRDKSTATLRMWEVSSV